jgi:hypothetical protein
MFMCIPFLSAIKPLLSIYADKRQRMTFAPFFPKRLQAGNRACKGGGLCLSDSQPLQAITVRQRLFSLLRNRVRSTAYRKPL